ncbi:lipoprotein BA_5634 family protein [Cytobacillus massiliigabonensis]|uniref:lipoprotein BA_5634 family protein n=1 Tax=Cytobacillus massiliigabonensis TaxID=1871011 RepID=UPI000C84614C|nr:lipoprotein BA_5634 family protein [Cytobacillus massiliigabonensis]
MRKILSVCMTAILASSMITGCSAIKDVFEKANGVILYGDQQQITDSIKQEQNDLIKKDEYAIKVVENGGKKILLLNEKTAKDLVEKELIKKVTNETDTEPITSLPKVTKGKGVLFAKQKAEVHLDGMQLDVSYEGNKVIGDGRRYVDMFLIIDDADFSVIKGDEKAMGIIKYDKDPAKKLPGFDVEQVQLVRIEE